MICQNKRAGYEYFLLDEYEAGIVLTGDEIKSIRAGHMSINESFVIVKDGKAELKNAYIKPYANSFNRLQSEDDARKNRTLLLHKSEIKKLANAVSIEGLTIVPVKVYFSKSWIKICIAVARGKKLYDKKDAKKLKDIDRETSRILAG